MIASPRSTRLAISALLISVGALAFSLGVDATRQTCQTRPTAQLIQ